MKNNVAALTLSVSDVLRTRRSDIYTQSYYFVQETFRTRNPQFFRFQFNYRFGKLDASLLKRRNNKVDVDDL
jgi:hypothetical protein